MRRSYKISSCFIIFLGLLYSCSSESRIDREKVKQEMENRKIKKVKDHDIIEHGFKMGSYISSESEKALLNLLQNAIQEKGIEGAVEYCNLAVNPLMDSLKNEHKAIIGRTSHRLRNKNNKPDQSEKEILEAYLYNVEKGYDLTENIQLLNDEYVLYTKPIKIGSTLCLNCHGKESKEVTEKTLNKIKELYPEDNATGFELGEFRGMWSIKIPKKEIILNL
jgi:hypothetical protein